MAQIHPEIGTNHPLQPDNNPQDQTISSGNGLQVEKSKFDEIIPDGLPASIKPFLKGFKPNGDSVVFRIPETVSVNKRVEIRSRRRRIAAGLFASALVVGAIGVGRLLLRR